MDINTTGRKSSRGVRKKPFLSLGFDQGRYTSSTKLNEAPQTKHGSSVRCNNHSTSQNRKLSNHHVDVNLGVLGAKIKIPKAPLPSRSTRKDPLVLASLNGFLLTSHSGNMSMVPITSPAEWNRSRDYLNWSSSDCTTPPNPSLGADVVYTRKLISQKSRDCRSSSPHSPSRVYTAGFEAKALQKNIEGANQPRARCIQAWVDRDLCIMGRGTEGEEEEKEQKGMEQIVPKRLEMPAVIERPFAYESMVGCTAENIQDSPWSVVEGKSFPSAVSAEEGNKGGYELEQEEKVQQLWSKKTMVRAPNDPLAGKNMSAELYMIQNQILKSMHGRIFPFVDVRIPQDVRNKPQAGSTGPKTNTDEKFDPCMVGRTIRFTEQKSTRAAPAVRAGSSTDRFQRSIHKKFQRSSIKPTPPARSFEIVRDFSEDAIREHMDAAIQAIDVKFSPPAPPIFISRS